MGDKSALPFGIASRVRDRTYLDSLHDAHCWVCGATPCDPAHMRWGSEGGTGLKPDDSLAVPLCHAHHMEQEANPGPEWWAENVLKSILRRRYRNWLEAKTGKWPKDTL